MSRPTVSIISPKGESSSESIAVPNVFKVCEPTARTTISARAANAWDREYEDEDAKSAIGNNTSRLPVLVSAMRCGLQELGCLMAEMVANDFAGPHQA
jgi:hypothetical protein